MNSNELRRAAEHMDPGWDEHRARRVYREVFTIRARRQHRRWATRAALGTASAALVALFVLRPFPESDRAASDLPSQRTVRGSASETLSDGAVIEGRTEATRLRVDERKTLVEVDIEAGVVSFDVPSGRRPHRPYRVRAGRIRVDVVGTRFIVERETPEVVRVEVTEGRVRVSAPTQELTLSTGEQRSFGPRDAAAARKPAPSKANKRVRGPPSRRRQQPRRREARVTKRESAPGEDWQSLAQAGHFEQAAEALGSGPVPDTVDELLLAADALRLTGDFQSAIEYLDRVIDEHPGDDRAPLAMFTKGRLLARTDLRGAARIFAQAHAHPMAGALAEDALAREVEAWAKLGNQPQARTRARLYLRLYPKGHRLRAVRAFAGMD